MLIYSLLTYSMQQSTSLEASMFLASQEIPPILWNPKVHYHSHKCLPPFLILSYSPGSRLTLWLFCIMIRFYGEELLAPRPTPKLEYHLLAAVRDCLFNIFAATLHIGGRSSIRNLRMRHVTGTHVRGITVIHSTFRKETLALVMCPVPLPRSL